MNDKQVGPSPLPIDHNVGAQSEKQEPQDKKIGDATEIPLDNVGNDAKRVNHGEIDRNIDASPVNPPLPNDIQNVHNAAGGKDSPLEPIINPQVINPQAEGQSQAQQLPPLPPEVAALEPKQPVPLVEVEELPKEIEEADITKAWNEIDGKIKADDHKLSTSELLKQLNDKAKEVGGEISSSSLKMDPQGKFVTEPWTSPDRPGETFYKIEATYRIEIKGKPPLELKRYIISTATEPETLLLFATKYKDMRVELAKANDQDKGRLDLGAGGASLDELRKQQYFTFKGSYDQTTGQAYRLDSISTVSKDKPVEFKLREKTSDDFYVQRGGSHAFVRTPQKDVKSEIFGQVFYKTEDEYLINASYVIEGQGIYEDSEKDQKTDTRLSEIKKQIKKKKHN